MGLLIVVSFGFLASGFVLRLVGRISGYVLVC